MQTVCIEILVRLTWINTKRVPQTVKADQTKDNGNTKQPFPIKITLFTTPRPPLKVEKKKRKHLNTKIQTTNIEILQS